MESSILTLLEDSHVHSLAQFVKPLLLCINETRSWQAHSFLSLWTAVVNHALTRQAALIELEVGWKLSRTQVLLVFRAKTLES